MPDARIAAHLILGPREEPFLAALLESLDRCCSVLIVNDNAPEPSPHTRVLSDSAFGRSDRIFVDRTPFTDFATARNICIRKHLERQAGEWAAFVDADEVHGEAFRRIANNVDAIPANVDFVDGYTWHFFQSFDWYRSIERRMSLFRCTPQARWEGAVHERLQGLNGERIALPYVYAHYGWVLPIARQADKERLYAGLGAPGKLLPPREWAAPDLARSFAQEWPRVLRFGGKHPRAASATIDRLRAELAPQLAQVDEVVRGAQTPLDRLRNAVMKANYEQRWRFRALSAPARRLLSPRG